MQFNLTKEQKQFIYDCGIKATNDRIYDILGISNDNNYTTNALVKEPLAEIIKEPLAEIVKELTQESLKDQS